MVDEFQSAEIRTRKFGVSRRGFDRAEVSEYLSRVADHVAGLEEELGVIHTRLDQLGISELPDFKREMDDLGVEIQGVLSSARDAAQGIRTRAREDADALVADAEATSAATRGDAWDAGSELLRHAEQTAAALLAEAKDDALFIRAEAEQDAKRLVSDARRQAEDMVRSSREEGEKIVVIAKAESEAILEGARQAAEKAQERARALENRRTELLGELEAAESAMREVEAKRSGTQPAVGRRVTAGEDITRWPEDDGAIRILPAAAAEKEPGVTTAAVDAEEIAAEVAQMQSAALPEPDTEVSVDTERVDLPAETQVIEQEEADRAASAEPEPQSDDELEAEATAADIEQAPETEPEPATEPVAGEVEAEIAPDQAAPAVAKTTVVEDDAGIAALFARLREPAEPEAALEPAAEVAAEVAGEEPAAEPEPEAPVLQAVPDLVIGEGFERRDRMLLPIENTGLRGLKRRIVELQNRVLEELRTSGGHYRLGRELVFDMMGDELDSVLRESFLAGHAAAAHSLGVEEPQATGGPNQGAAEEFSLDLHRGVQDVIGRGTEAGNRRLASDVSRVFRSWRTDDAERHVRVAARRAFNDGLLAGYKRLGIAAVEYAAPGRPCGECAADTGVTWAPIDDPPPGVDVAPVGAACAALVVPAGSGGFDSPSGQ